jgi:hypothetical protein
VPSTGTRPLLELACEARNLAEIAPLYEFLDAAGYSVVCSQPEQGYVTDAMLTAFLGPLVAFVDAGGNVADAAATLDDFGFIPSPLTYLRNSDWRVEEEALEALAPGVDAQAAREAIAHLAEPSDEQGTPNEALNCGLLLSLLHTVLQVRSSGALRHVSIADVIAREMLGFPVGMTSLGEYLSVERVAELLERSEAFAAWTGDAVIATAEQYVDAGRNFYK